MLENRCAEYGRDGATVLRTSVAGVFFLADSADAARAKLTKLPPWLITGVEGFPGLEGLVFAGTPEQAVAHVRGLVDAGF